MIRVLEFEDPVLNELTLKVNDAMIRIQDAGGKVHQFMIIRNETANIYAGIVMFET